ncbi:B12-binding domain-containing radical SAM protein [Pseudodesulfovibrio sp.]|uniref:B12-binding domain-containing radical SAM protein n=1 Tax=unclassified Pseudodesulfovibrio TaxID=2661612 RepID=UPI003AFFA4BF
MNVAPINLAPQEPGTSHTEVSPILKNKFSQLHYPTGLSIIAGVLESAGVEFKTYDTYTFNSHEEVLRCLVEDNCDILMTFGYLGNYTYSFFKRYFGLIKQRLPQCRIVVGGPIASTIPEHLIKYAHVDIAVIGEGEETTIDLVDTLGKGRDLAAVKGIAFRKQNKMQLTEPRRRLADLDAWLLPDLNRFNAAPYIDFLKRTNRCWELVASRGCYGKCTFCRRVFGSKITRISPPRAFELMHQVYTKFGLTRFSFVDDNFLSNTSQAEGFANVLQAQDMDYQWRFQARVDAISPEIIQRLSSLGLFDVSFGVESGSDKMLKSYRKKITSEEIIRVLSNVKKHVDIHATFIVGGPGEDWSTVEETAELIRRLELNNAGVGILTPSPDTEIYEEALKKRHYPQ